MFSLVNLAMHRMPSLVQRKSTSSFNIEIHILANSYFLENTVMKLPAKIGKENNAKHFRLYFFICFFLQSLLNLILPHYGSATR